MQTFLPYPSFVESARCLDNRRLNKQITECKQIALAISDPSYGWQHHPAVEMWRGCLPSLLSYGLEMYLEWTQRFDDGRRGGKRDHKAGEWLITKCHTIDSETKARYKNPSWLYNPAFHASHRAALLYKDSEWYGQFGWSEAPAVPDSKGSLPYVWPGMG